MKLVKKLLIIGISIFLLGVLTFIFTAITYHFWPEMWYKIGAENPNAQNYNNEKPNNIYIISTEGPSMEPTLSTKEEHILINKSLVPKPSDIIAFQCFSEKCAHGDELAGRVKRLIKINENGCYWVEGDNKEHSWDSRNYGWLCPDDIKIDGVVIQ